MEMQNGFSDHQANLLNNGKESRKGYIVAVQPYCTQHHYKDENTFYRTVDSLMELAMDKIKLKGGTLDSPKVIYSPT